MRVDWSSYNPSSAEYAQMISDLVNEGILTDMGAREAQSILNRKQRLGKTSAVYTASWSRDQEKVISPSPPVLETSDANP